MKTTLATNIAAERSKIAFASRIAGLVALSSRLTKSTTSRTAIARRAALCGAEARVVGRHWRTRRGPTMAREGAGGVSSDDARDRRRAEASTSSESESESETSPRERAVMDYDDGCLDSDEFAASLKALVPRRRNIDATMRAQERACIDITLAADSLRGFLTNARDDEGSSEGAAERRDALEAAALTKRIVAIAAETRAIVNRVRKKLIEAGFVDVEALTPYDPGA